ncbi:beta-hexosaminidase subunit alpha-like [Oppia nitens]|uniref:beta-hexosaminidase subunit alpha-like n=1 Tax=Oppia nitens TaxID=1686743 RepID=UPI0023DB7245|nr:beta-hexosaminidase subunit alpha-like [Oppia nitens]
MIFKFVYLLFCVIFVQESTAQVWPHPQSVKATKNYLQIDSKQFTFTEKSPEKCVLLSAAITRTKNVTFIQNCGNTRRGGQQNFYNTLRSLDNEVNYNGGLSGITVEIGSCEQLPHLGMNENYTLVINATTGEAYIKAPVIWGAIRGLETFSQLIANVGPNQFVINETQIVDFPRFAYRGLMVDTARHYLPLDLLYSNLDAMAYNKLNVFHWHIVDDQSFPYVSDVFPDLHRKGAYNPVTHIYSQQDIHNIIEYARQRGIRVVVEFDTPGHTQSWGKSQKDLLTECYTNGTKNGKYGPIDPSNEKVYEFIEKLFAEVTHTFPDQYFHLGGDEVDFTCWESNPNIKRFMADKKIKSYSKLEDYYMQRVVDIMKKLKKSYIVWEEVFNNGVDLKEDTVVHVWIGSWGTEKEKYWRPELQNVTSKGYRAILSSCWYLDLISYGPDWQKYYQCEPHSFNGTDKQKSLVIGGEPAVWAEYINAGNFISRTWPRASAAAERLWSPKSFIMPSEAAERFHQQNCRMMERGLSVEPNEGPGYCRCDYAL